MNNQSLDKQSLDTTDPILSIRRLGIIKITVSDMERSLRFYKGVLGFGEGEQMLSPGVTLTAGEVSLYLSELEPPWEPEHRAFGTYPTISICLIVRGVRTAYERCREAGVAMAGEYNEPNEHFATMQLADPDGNVVEIWGAP